MQQAMRVYNSHTTLIYTKLGATAWTSAQISGLSSLKRNKCNNIVQIGLVSRDLHHSSE